jgi:hypothetical protein
MCHHHGEDSFVITSRQHRIDWCIQCVFQGLVHSTFLENIMLFPAEKKTRSIPTPNSHFDTVHEHQRGTDPSVWCVGCTYHFLSLESNSWQKQGKYKATTNRIIGPPVPFSVVVSDETGVNYCVTILPITDCVREWRNSPLLRGTSTVPFSRVDTIPKKIQIEQFFSWPGWTVGHCHWQSYKSRRYTGYVVKVLIIVIIKMKLPWLSRSMILPLGTFPWLSLSVIHPKTSLKRLILIILSTYRHFLNSVLPFLWIMCWSTHCLVYWHPEVVFEKSTSNRSDLILVLSNARRSRRSCQPLVTFFRLL